MNMPIKLKKEPLIDAIFECRVQPFSNIPLSGILPGIIFSHFSSINDKTLERLPLYDIPELVRKNEPNLQYMPLVKVSIPGYMFLIGDNILAISVSLPYKGWLNFKQNIIDVLQLLKEKELISTVERFSLKYINLIEASSEKEQYEKLNLKLEIGGYVLANEPFQTRMDIKKGEFTSIVQLLSNAKVTINNTIEKEGAVIDIDTIKELNHVAFDEFSSTISQELDELHNISKKMFFNCLKNNTIKELGAIYE